MMNMHIQPHGERQEGQFDSSQCYHELSCMPAGAGGHEISHEPPGEGQGSGGRQESGWGVISCCGQPPAQLHGPDGRFSCHAESEPADIFQWP